MNGRYAHVVGYGVDPLSFLPNVAGSSGLPDYLHQGIIYGSALLFQDIVANNKNFVFVYNNRNSNNVNLLINNIRGCMLDNGAYLVDTINYLTKNTPIVEKSDVAFELKLTSFNKSFFRLN